MDARQIVSSPSFGLFLQLTITIVFRHNLVHGGSYNLSFMFNVYAIRRLAVYHAQRKKIKCTPAIQDKVGF
jgi:hypothetical protein